MLTSEISLFFCIAEKKLHDYKINQTNPPKFHVGTHKEKTLFSDLFLGMKSCG